MVKEIQSLQEFEKEIRYPGLVVVDFFTTWCGPCKMIAPIIEQFATKYPEVKFIKVDIEKNEDIAAPRRIQSIPTFHFIVNGNQVDEMKGANPTTLEQKINQHKLNANPFGGTGNKLSGTTGNELSAREARLKAFGSLEQPRAAIPPPAPVAAVAKPSTDEDEDEVLQRAMVLSIAEQHQAKALAAAPATSSSKQQEAADLAAAEQEFATLEAQSAAAPEIHTKPTTANGEWDEEMVPVPVNAEILEQLIEMEFPDVRARKGIVHGGTLEGALTWLSEHENDPEIDQPYLVKKSDTIPKPPMTAEEKAKKIEDMKNKIKQRREDRSKQEKVDEIRREKERRERGQKIDETLEERQRIQRKLEQEKLKREKLVRK
jgi:thioredoxin 1